jgi:hypothetical protein
MDLHHLLLAGFAGAPPGIPPNPQIWHSIWHWSNSARVALIGSNGAAILTQSSAGSAQNRRAETHPQRRPDSHDAPRSYTDLPATFQGDPEIVGGAISEHLQRYLSRQYLLDPRLRIWYLVPHLDQDPRNASSLQLYTPGILRTAAVFAQLASWPADIREWSSAPQDVLIHRILGHLDQRMLPIEFSAFEQIVNDRSRPFLCVISSSESHEFVTRRIASSRGSWLHVSTGKIPDAIEIEDVTPAVLRDYAVQAMQKFAKNCPHPDFPRMTAPLLSEPIFDARIKLEETERRHGVTLPNEVALRAFGFDLTQLEYLVPNNPDAYVRANSSGRSYRNQPCGSRPAHCRYVASPPILAYDSGYTGVREET